MRSLLSLVKNITIAIATGIVFSTSAFGAEAVEKGVKNFPLHIFGNLSPWNKESGARPFTDYIILHTTGAPDGSSINSTKNDGSAHYVVKTNGEIHLIVLEDKIANHAGESIWDGKTQLNYYSLGIEVVGYPDKELTTEQYDSLGILVKHLQEKYNIPDENVLTHAAVSYRISSDPHVFSYRGRKVDGVNIDMKRIGIHKRPIYDPDVLSGVTVPAVVLEKALYPKQFLVRSNLYHTKKNMKGRKS